MSVEKSDPIAMPVTCRDAPARQQALSVYIPVYNEYEAVPTIGYNIKRINKIFPGTTHYISDNCSTDQTWEALAELKKSMPEYHIVLRRNLRNIGFSGNLAAIDIVDSAGLIFTLGATSGIPPVFSRKSPLKCHL